MINVVFDDVVVENPPIDGPWGDSYYKCENVLGGVATGATWPVPPCFADKTTPRSTFKIKQHARNFGSAVQESRLDIRNPA
jgi:hypothetical protein